MSLYDGDTFDHKGREFTVRIRQDEDMGEPWKEHDGHGPVSDWTRRDKAPGELVLIEDHGSKRYYDLKAATEEALRDGWDTLNPPAPADETKRQKAARAARADYEHLRAWCADRWQWVYVVVRSTEDKTVFASLSGIESSDDTYLETIAHELAEECLESLGAACWWQFTKEGNRA